MGRLIPNVKLQPAAAYLSSTENLKQAGFVTAGQSQVAVFQYPHLKSYIWNIQSVFSIKFVKRPRLGLRIRVACLEKWKNKSKH